jgi:hypothetical protein
VNGSEVDPSQSVSCGALRRDADGRWFFGSTYLGRDGEPLMDVDSLESRSSVVAARLARELEHASRELELWGDLVAAGRAPELLRRYERWRSIGIWS